MMVFDVFRAKRSRSLFVALFLLVGICSGTTRTTGAAAATMTMCETKRIDFDSLPRGTTVTGQFHNDLGVTIDCDGVFGCRIFDSAIPVASWHTGPCEFACHLSKDPNGRLHCEGSTVSPDLCGDPDLGSPNARCPGGGGPGYGIGGEPWLLPDGVTNIHQNCRALGHMLVIDESGPDFPPDDRRDGGIMYFSFDEPVNLMSAVILDSEGSEEIIFEAYDMFGNALASSSASLPGDNGKAMVPLRYNNTATLHVIFTGSGSLVDLVWERCNEITTTIPATGGLTVTCKTCDPNDVIYYYFKYETNSQGDVRSFGLVTRASNLNINTCTPIHTWLKEMDSTGYDITLHDSTNIINEDNMNRVINITNVGDKNNGIVAIELPDGYWIVPDAHAHKGGKSCTTGSPFEPCSNTVVFRASNDEIDGTVNDISHVVFIFAECGNPTSSTAVPAVTTTTVAGPSTEVFPTTNVPNSNSSCACENGFSFYYFKYNTNDDGTVNESGFETTASSIHNNTTCSPIFGWLAANQLEASDVLDSEGILQMDNIAITRKVGKPNGQITVTLPEGYFVFGGAAAHAERNRDASDACFQSPNFQPCDGTVTFELTQASGDGIAYIEFIIANCDGDKNDCGAGGDPHFQLWGQEHATFHGECDLVLVHSDGFHGGIGFDLHARTTIESYFSYIETAALRVGENAMEFHKDYLYFNGVKLQPNDLPFTFGGHYQYTVSVLEVDVNKNAKHYRYYHVDLHQDSTVRFRFYKQYLTVNMNGHRKDFSDSVGLLGSYKMGTMLDRDGRRVGSLTDLGFEWQVNPSDRNLFTEEPLRPPQLPYERCRLPTAARTSQEQRRNLLRARNDVLLVAAEKACAHLVGESDFRLCVDDVTLTGDLGLADLW